MSNWEVDKKNHIISSVSGRYNDDFHYNYLLKKDDFPEIEDRVKICKIFEAGLWQGRTEIQDEFKNLMRLRD